MEVKLYDLGITDDSLIKYVAILVKHRDKWVLSKHKDRSTWEFAGGHREEGETLGETAARELYEETGAADFSIVPVSIYSVIREDHEESFGKLYFAVVYQFGSLPDYEMSEVRTFDQIPKNLTHPHIYPILINTVLNHLKTSPIPLKFSFNREWLTKKFEEIRRRSLKAIEQLNDDQLNWRPDTYSHNIPNLLRHIAGNMQERILSGILKEDIARDRDKESNIAYMTKDEAELLIQNTLQIIIDLIEKISDEALEEFQMVRGKQRTNLDMLHQCAAHYSEHMGQIFYISKLILQDKYKSTSV
jgi:nucleoside triphosphatase YtkD